MSAHSNRRRTTPPQNAPVARKGLNTARADEARDQPLAHFLAPNVSGIFWMGSLNPFAGDDAE